MDLKTVSVSLNLNVISICLSIICSGIVIAKTIARPLKKLLKLQEKQTNAIRCCCEKKFLKL